MLNVDEFHVGEIGDVESLSLIIPGGDYEDYCLISRIEGKISAVSIANFYSFQTSQAPAGVIVNGIRIEVDETSAFDPHQAYAPPGSIVREATRLCISARSQNGSTSRKIVLLEGLKPIGEWHRVGFLRWQIVIGQLCDKRVLKIVEAKSST